MTGVEPVSHTDPQEHASSFQRNGYDEYGAESDAPVNTTSMPYESSHAAEGMGTTPYSPSEPRVVAQPLRPRPTYAPNNNAAVETSAAGSGRVVPRGALELLPHESVAFQLGALYLTNKRVILLAPSVVRAAFLRDVDAVGTLTERASGWSLFFGLLFLALAGGGMYAWVARGQLESLFPLLYEMIDLRIIAGALAILAVALLVMYIFWVKRTLFVSVKGRPLITVSVSDWNARKLEGMDSFVNAFFQTKDAALEYPD